ncbi:hypothetical protein GGR55DRAFT_53669 [Xylaria sp. FL0064]|nr:hypothetical protein GGR55DRAFT_53669 [Xylaria sp. FL0064]
MDVGPSTCLVCRSPEQCFCGRPRWRRPRTFSTCTHSRSPQERLKHFVNKIRAGVPSLARANALDTLLRFQDAPRRSEHKDVSFSNRYRVIKLVVGSYAYWLLPYLYVFSLEPLVLPFIDLREIARPPNIHRPVDRSQISNQLYEPCIAAVLIALAQEKENADSSPDGSAVKQTQLLFTHFDDRQDMYVYTARISKHLLDRFRHPNQRPKSYACSHTTPPPLIKLEHRRVPYEPHDTFRQCMLAVVSIAATTMHKDDYSGPRKRKFSHACDVIDCKRLRQEDMQTPRIVSRLPSLVSVVVPVEGEVSAN